MQNIRELIGQLTCKLAGELIWAGDLVATEWKKTVGE